MNTMIEEPVIHVKRKLDDDIVRSNWVWLLIASIITLIAGVSAIILPRLAAFVVDVFIGWLLVLEGVLSIIHALQIRKSKGFGWRLAGAIAALGIGILLLVYPMAGIFSLTILAGTFFLLSGVTKGFMASRLRPYKNTGGLIFVSIIDIALALCIFLLLPESSFIIGTLVGISLIVNGFWLFALSLTARKTASSER